MSNSRKQPRCPSCAGVDWLDAQEHTCFVCRGHSNYHRTYDPRCPLCIVQRVKALWKAVVIMTRQMLPQRG